MSRRRLAAIVSAAVLVAGCTAQAEPERCALIREAKADTLAKFGTDEYKAAYADNVLAHNRQLAALGCSQ